MLRDFQPFRRPSAAKRICEEKIRDFCWRRFNRVVHLLSAYMGRGSSSLSAIADRVLIADRIRTLPS
jgi:hypothetical protein